MTLDEAQKIGTIAGTADHGCHTCVSALVERLNAAFPAYVWTMEGPDTRERPEWSDDPDDIQTVGLGVQVRPRMTDQGKTRYGGAAGGGKTARAQIESLRAYRFKSPDTEEAAAELAQIIERTPCGDPYESVTKAGAEKAARDCVAMLESMGWTPPPRP